MLVQATLPPSVAFTRRRRDYSLLRALIVVAVIAGGAFFATLGRAAENGSATGLPLPRFATTRNDPINVRVGPGVRYDIAWVYVKSGMPVEIVQEFDTWRKIRDVDGSEGWVHQSLLSGKRAGIAAPWQKAEPIALLSGRSDSEGVRAYLASGYRIDISRCDGTWCEVSAVAPDASHTYSGFLKQSDIWGVYEGEEFD